MTEKSEGKPKRLSVKKQAVKTGGRGKKGRGKHLRKKGHLRKKRKNGHLHLRKKGHLRSD
jgi:hypothetical protein